MSEIKYTCEKCGWASYARFVVRDSSAPGGVKCPTCADGGRLAVTCDHKGCWKLAQMGFRVGEVYRHVCHEHLMEKEDL